MDLTGALVDKFSAPDHIIGDWGLTLLLLGIIVYTFPIWLKANGMRPSVTFVMGMTGILAFGSGVGVLEDEPWTYLVIRGVAALWILVYVYRLSRWHSDKHGK